MTNQRRVSRRMFLGGSIGVAGLASNLVALSIGPKPVEAAPAIITIPNITEASIASKTPGLPPSSILASLPFMGPVDPKANGFDPAKILTVPNAGKASRLPTGQVLREYILTATNKTILVAPGKQFDALAYNGQVPGPTLRANAGDHIRITLINKSDTAHGLNFSGIHSGVKDALSQPVAPGKSMVYEFDAAPFGLYIYRGIALPLNASAFKGLYGTLIVDPPQPRPLATELFMTLNGFSLGDSNNSTKISPDTNSTKVSLDAAPPDSNDIYTINTVAYQFVKNPIPIGLNKLVRVYIVNVTEFDLLNSFHLHSNVFNIYRSGTSLKPDGINSTVMLGPGQRAILEFSFKAPGQYMFHAYQGEYAVLGCMGIFNVK